ncbi:MAG: hypothetical protein ACK5LX_14095 [Oscillospiraceae bacterium]
MKITALTCAQCGAKLKIKDPNAKTAHCEHCGHDFVLERENPEIHHTTINNTFVDKKRVVSSGKRKGGGAFSSFLILLTVVIPFLAIVIPVLITVYNEEISVPTQSSHSMQPQATQNWRKVPESDLMRSFVTYVFDKQPEEVSVEDLAAIKYMRFSWIETTAFHGYGIYWSEEDPLTAKTFEPNCFYYPLTYGSNALAWRDLQCFTGLTVLDMGNIDEDIIDDEADNSSRTQICDLDSLTNLRAYRGAYYQSLNHVNFAAPEKITALDIRLQGKEDFELLLDFKNLVSLDIGYVSKESDYAKLAELKKLESLRLSYFLEDISWISSLTGLKTLAVDRCDNIEDYSVLYGMPNLTELTLDNADNLLDISFVSNMPKLKSLRITDSKILNINPLSNMLSIQSLVLEGNHEINDYSPLATLSSLRTLSVSDQQAVLPDLSGHTHLETVEVGGKNLSAVNRSQSIKSLTYQGRNVSIDAVSGADFAQMSNLESLSIQAYIESPVGLEKLEKLRYLNLMGGLTYDGDWSLVFSLPVLEELIINGRFRINPENIPDNDVLRVLNIQMPEFFALKNNERTSWGTAGDYIARMHGLEELYLPDIKLESVDFLSEMEQLRVVDISKNYVADFGPLTSLENLEELYYGGNPVRNLELLPAQVKLYNYRFPGYLSATDRHWLGL